MTGGLISLRTMLVSRSADDQALFRRVASEAPILIENVEADSAAKACQAVDAGIDLVFIDGGLPGADTAQVIAAGRAVAKPPFIVSLAAKGAADAALATDAVAKKPANLREAKRLVERSSRVRLPSRVLLVDDSSTMRSIVRKILGATRFPFEVSEASEGSAAIKLAAEIDFDIVFLDYNMPGINGLEILTEFKRERRQLTAVVMSTAQDELLPDRVHEQSAAFPKKPFYPADIEAVLTRYYGLIALNSKRA